MKKLSILVILCIALLTVACNDNYTYEADNGFDYVPVRYGKSSEFKVSKTTYAIGQAPLINEYIQREMVTDSFSDPTGKTMYKLAYSVPDSTSWKTDSINTLWFEKDQALIKEGGDVIVRLMLPLYEMRFWDGNQFNNKGRQYFELRNYKRSYPTPAETFPQTVTIVRRHDSTLVSKKVHIEVYAKGVGLIRRERSFLQYCNTPDCVGKGIVNSGWEEISTLKGYEK